MMQGDRLIQSDRELARKILAPQENLDDVAHWKTHRGKPEECLVQVQAGAKSFTGLVIRCDGFLMVPHEVWDTVKDRKPVEVWVTQAEGESSRGPFRVHARNPLKSRVKDYHFVKLNGHHLRCLPALASWNLAKDIPLRVLWARLSSDGESLVVQSAEAVCGEPSRERGVTTCTLVYKGTPPTDIPAGAVVLDAESQALVGMLTDPKEPTRFATTRHFGELCAEVALAPHRDATRGVDPGKSSLPVQGRMEKITGKPMITTYKAFAENYQTTIVCTPDFHCDIYLATIGEWQQFLGFRRDRPLPGGWDSRNRTNPPTRYPRLPVLSAIAGDMQDYAAWRNKRLITTTEWQLAAQTSNPDWLERLQREEAEVSAELAQAEAEYYQGVAHRVQTTQFQLAQLPQNSPARRLLNEGAGLDIPTDDLKQLYDARINDTRRRHAKFVARLPGQAQEVGSRPEDKSDWGIFDMNLNAPEACLGWGKNFGFAAKVHPAGQDPFISTIYFMGTRSPLGASPRERVGAVRGTIAGTAVDDPAVWAAMWNSQFGGTYRHQAPGIEYYIEVVSKIELAFRCAW